MSQILDYYKSVGNEQFGKLITEGAPYFGTIEPKFVAVKQAYVEVKIENRKEIHNHLGTVHAAAMCNAAELVGGLMTEVSLPERRRWIPSAMDVKYLAKAKTDLTAIADGSNIEWSTLGEIAVPVDIFDNENTRVFTAQITMNIKETS
jgi:acyl-coenzyme A thioesterase PaaI-like protein